MKQLLPTNLWVIEVPEDAIEFKQFDRKNSICYFSRCDKYWHWIDAHFNFSVIGTVTKNSIDFDAEPFLIKNGPLTKDRVYLFEDYTEHSLGFENSQESFYSLLQVNGFHFVNPCDKPETEYDSEGHPHYPLQEYIDEWQKYENALVKKLLILQRI